MDLIHSKKILYHHLKTNHLASTRRVKRVIHYTIWIKSIIIMIKVTIRAFLLQKNLKTYQLKRVRKRRTNRLQVDLKFLVLLQQNKKMKLTSKWQQCRIDCMDLKTHRLKIRSRRPLSTGFKRKNKEKLCMKKNEL